MLISQILDIEHWRQLEVRIFNVLPLGRYFKLELHLTSRSSDIFSQLIVRPDDI